jgi:hypothetical protein
MTCSDNNHLKMVYISLVENVTFPSNETVHLSSSEHSGSSSREFNPSSVNDIFSSVNAALTVVFPVHLFTSITHPTAGLYSGGYVASILEVHGSNFRFAACNSLQFEVFTTVVAKTADPGGRAV